MLKMAAIFFSRADLSRLKIGLLGPLSPFAEQTVERDCRISRADSSRIIVVMMLDQIVPGEMIADT